MKQIKKTKKKKQIIVFTGILIAKGKILLSLRDEPECRRAHMKWEFPGGKPEFNELPEDCVVREFREETGCEVKVKKLIPSIITTNWDYDWGVQQTFCFVFKVKLVKQHKRMKDHHVVDVKWFDLSEVKKLKTLPGMLEMLKLA